MISSQKNNLQRSSRQLIKYYKSNHKTIIPINEENTGTLSLLAFSYPQNTNSTYSIKPKNIILQKLDTINKRLKRTLKQLQSTTSKSFINFDFNHTQIKEDNSEFLSNSLLNSKYKTEKNSYVQKQKSSNLIKNSSIPKPKHSYKNQNMEIDSKSNSVKLKAKPFLENNLNEEGCKYKIKRDYNNRNKKEINNKNIIESFGESSFEEEEEEEEEEKEKEKEKEEKEEQPNFKIHICKIPSNFSLLNIPYLKSTMSLKQNDSFDKEKEKEIDINTGNEEKVQEKTNNENTDKNSLENETRSNLEKSLFNSPQGLALVLFILYATFVF